MFDQRRALRLWLRECQSLMIRAGAYPSLAIFWREPPRKKFIIFGQDRSGSTLLTQLLNCSPEVHCDNEILTQKVLWPYLYVRALSMRHPGRVYGFKLRFYELTRQKLDPRGFLLAHYRQGGQIIYLRRSNILRQTISGMIAAQTGLWRSDRRAHQARRNKKFHIDCESLLRNLRWRETQLVQEQGVLKDFPHIPVVYEEDLLNAERHQQVLNKLFHNLGVDPVPVRAGLIRMPTDNLADVVENFDEVAKVVANSPYAFFLSDNDRLSKPDN